MDWKPKTKFDTAKPQDLDCLVAVHPRPQAAPSPQLRSLDQTCRHGISLDVAQQGQQVVVTLHRETLEPSLIEVPVPHGSVRNAPAHRVRVSTLPEEACQLTILLRPDNKVPVIGQNTIRQDTQRLPLVRLDHDPLERLKVSLLSEHMHPADRSVKDVINQSPRRYSRCSWHSRKGYQNAGPASILVASPFPSRHRWRTGG